MRAKRNLNPTEMIVKNKLGLQDWQVIAFTEIYEFIGRFAYILDDFRRHEVYKWRDIKVGDRNIPPKTLEILEKLGNKHIAEHFSLLAYPKKFLGFVKKLTTRNRKIVLSDYICDGAIKIDPPEVEIVEFA